MHQSIKNSGAHAFGQINANVNPNRREWHQGERREHVARVQKAQPRIWNPFDQIDPKKEHRQRRCEPDGCQIQAQQIRIDGRSTCVGHEGGEARCDGEDHAGALTGLTQ